VAWSWLLHLGGKVRQLIVIHRDLAAHACLVVTGFVAAVLERRGSPNRQVKLPGLPRLQRDAIGFVMAMPSFIGISSACCCCIVASSKVNSWTAWHC